MKKEPTGVIGRIVELMRAHPQGLTSGEIREKLGLAANEQSQLDRRRRDVRKWYQVIVVPNGNNPRYRLGEKLTEVHPTGINGKLRASVLHLARGRCQMCGKTVAEDEVKLQIDHKIPQAWGGTNELDNLWALCEECNHGKKDLFSSQEESVKAVLKYKSIHMRIGELLKLNANSWVPAELIEFVANQDDWKKRTRELRYLGWTIEVTKRKHPSGRVKSLYKLTKHEEWPPDPTAWIREFEEKRAATNRSKVSSEQS